MKNGKIEYIIRRNGHYVQEGITFGVYNKVKKHEATSFPDLENVIRYIEDDLCLNVKTVSIIKVEYRSPKYTPLTMLNGDFVDSKLIDYCINCGKPFLLTELEYFQIDNCSMPQLYCPKHFEELDGKWVNHYNGN